MVATSATITTDTMRTEADPALLALLQERAGIVDVRGRSEPAEAAPSKTRRERIVEGIPSAAELDLIVVEPPAEWLADQGWQ